MDMNRENNYLIYLEKLRTEGQTYRLFLNKITRERIKKITPIITQTGTEITSIVVDIIAAATLWARLAIILFTS